MTTPDNPSRQNHIYDKQTRTWFEVTPEQFKEYDRWRTRIRKREQYHGRCMCPRSKWWLCDGMCQDCEYRASGDAISLDAPVTNEDGDEVTLADTLMDPNSLFVSAMCDQEELNQLLARLDELMPEAREIGRLRQNGWTDEAIGDVLSLHCWELIRAALGACTKEMQVLLAKNPVPPILNNARLEWVSLYLGREPYKGICKLSEQWVEAEDFDGIDADIHLYKVREKADDPLLQKLIGAYDADYPIAQREEAGTNAPTEV